MHDRFLVKAFTTFYSHHTLLSIAGISTIFYFAGSGGFGRIQQGPEPQDQANGTQGSHILQEEGKVECIMKTSHENFGMRIVTLWISGPEGFVFGFCWRDACCFLSLLEWLEINQAMEMGTLVTAITRAGLLPEIHLCGLIVSRFPLTRKLRTADTLLGCKL
jgi:hypothetical protein